MPATGFQRTPTLLIDEKYHRYILAYNAGLDASEPSRRRTYLAVADRPAVPSSVQERSPEPAALRFLSMEPNPTPGSTRLEFLLPEDGRLVVRIYSVTGRLVSTAARGRFAAGRQSVVWNRTSEAADVPSGVYVVRGVLESGGRTLTTAGRRLVIVQ